MTHKFYSVLIGILSMVLVSNSTAAQERKTVIKAADGATRVSIRLTIEKDQKATVVWGDGQSDVADANSGVNGSVTLNHTYATAITAESPFIEITTDHVTTIQDGYNGNIRGFISIDAPKLTEAALSYSNSYQNPKLDLSKCPLIETLMITNINELILPANCKLKNIRVTASDGYGANKIEGSARYLPSFAAEQCPLLEKIEMMSSSFTAIDLSQSPNLYHVDFAFSKTLREIKGIKDLKNLKVVKLNYCALGYDQIPDKTELMTATNYKYESQAPYLIPENRVNGFKVDLSNIHRVKGIATEEKVTKFEWKTAGSYTGTPIPADKITVTDGVFTFDESILGDKEAISIYVVMSNEGLPNIGAGYGNEKYKSESITLSKKPVKTYKLQYRVEGKGGKCIAATVADQTTTIMTNTDLIEGTELIFTATPDKGMRIKEWKLNGKVIADLRESKLNHTMNADATVLVAFEPITYTVTFGAELIDITTTANHLRSADYSIEAILEGSNISSPAVVPGGSVIQFTAKAVSPYNVYKWMSNTHTIQDVEAGSLIATLNATIESDTTITATFINTTSIVPVSTDEQASVMIYPNPTSGKAQIVSTQVIAAQEAILVDVRGSILARIALNETMTVDLSTLTPGIYFLRIGSQTHRIIRR